MLLGNSFLSSLHKKGAFNYVYNNLDMINVWIGRRVKFRLVYKKRFPDIITEII